jgi:hypothetical protein
MSSDAAAAARDSLAEAHGCAHVVAQVVGNSATVGGGPFVI